MWDGRTLALSTMVWVLGISGSYASYGEYNVANGLPPVKGQSISILQPFDGEFRILGYKNYQDDEQAKFSPVDFAVSWGLFADPNIASKISVQQYDRYLKWGIPYLPVPAEQAIQMVSNIHIIPANPQIAQQIKHVSRGDLVRLKGELVEIKADDLVWRSSLRFDDVGDGACEVFRVSSIEWLERPKTAKHISDSDRHKSHMESRSYLQVLDSDTV